MRGPDRTTQHSTHEVLNQPPPLEHYNVFDQDRALVEALQREGAGWAEEQVRTLGSIAGGEAIEWGIQANTHPPVLRTHNRYGHRIDEVEFHRGEGNLSILLRIRQRRAGAEDPDAARASFSTGC